MQIGSKPRKKPLFLTTLPSTLNTIRRYGSWKLLRTLDFSTLTLISHLIYST